MSVELNVAQAGGDSCAGGQAMGVELDAGIGGGSASVGGCVAATLVPCTKVGDGPETESDKGNAITCAKLLEAVSGKSKTVKGPVVYTHSKNKGEKVEVVDTIEEGPSTGQEEVQPVIKDQTDCGGTNISNLDIIN